MTRRLTLMACLAALLVVAACGGDSQQQDAPRLTSLEPGLQQACYAMGVDLGRQVAGMPGADDLDMMASGVRESLAGEARIDFNVAREIMSVQAHDHAEGEVHDHPDTWTERGFASEVAQKSYAVGVTVGQFVQMQMNDPDVDALMQGLMDKVEGEELLVDEEQIGEIITTYQQETAAQQAVANVAAGEQFLAENAKRSEVKVTESGLQYEVLQEGDGGEHPTAESTVKVHYHGTLIDGEVFDSSVERGEPISFPLNRVIPGWTEGVQLMTTGAKYKFFIPSDLAYGERGAGAKIGPNSTLVFEVELLEIQ